MCPSWGKRTKVILGVPSDGQGKAWFSQYLVQSWELCSLMTIFYHILSLLYFTICHRDYAKVFFFGKKWGVNITCTFWFLSLPDLSSLLNVTLEAHELSSDGPAFPQHHRSQATPNPWVLSLNHCLVEYFQEWCWDHWGLFGRLYPKPRRENQFSGGKSKCTNCAVKYSEGPGLFSQCLCTHWGTVLWSRQLNLFPQWCRWGDQVSVS